MIDAPGVRHDHVEAAELGDRLPDGVGHRQRIAHVGLHPQAASVKRLHRLDGVPQVKRRRHRVRHRRDVRAQVDRDDVGPLGRQPHGVVAALAAGRAGDQRHLARYPPHRRSCLPHAVTCLPRRRAGT
jgi:hypothetical protein